MLFGITNVHIYTLHYTSLQTDLIPYLMKRVKSHWCNRHPSSHWFWTPQELSPLVWVPTCPEYMFDLAKDHTNTYHSGLPSSPKKSALQKSYALCTVGWCTKATDVKSPVSNVPRLTPRPFATAKNSSFIRSSWRESPDQVTGSSPWRRSVLLLIKRQ